MKTKADLGRDGSRNGSFTRARRLCTAGLMALAFVAAAFESGGGQAEDAGLVAHEWGTFTSVQGGDGRPLTWKPLLTSVLPGFVYDWSKPGLGRQMAWSPAIGFSKGGMITLQRMETPVVYFYTDKPRTVDLEVQFPQGLITEWFPQAAQVGPSIIPPPHAAVAIDNKMHQNGVLTNVSVEALFRGDNVKRSLIHWSDIELLPAKNRADVAGLLPRDSSGSHYFAARDTDSAYVRLDSLSSTNPGAQYEKFLFYRGVANFTAPLTVQMLDKDALIVTNTGGEPLRHLFVLRIQNGSGAFVAVDQLEPGAMDTVVMPAEFKPLKDLKRQIGDRMASALQAEGLYPREAKAMVNTWRDSWFAESGVRVLYVLPRAWTDRTLPMKLEPAPRELTRVMVGRAEVLAPDVENQLVKNISDCKQDPQAFARMQGILQELGRFGEPALNLALSQTQPTSEQYMKFLAMLDAERRAKN